MNIPPVSYTHLQVVKLTTSLIFLAQPVLLSVIAKRKYKIDHKIWFTGEPIKQKWNGLAQHIATVVLGNTDTVVLTFLSTDVYKRQVHMKTVF